MDVFDLENLAQFAIKQHDLPVAIDTTKTIIQLIHQNKGLETLHRKMNHLAKKLARKNNQLLDEYQTFIASDHRLLSYKIDKTLEKSAYQPDYVENGKVKELKEIDDRGYEWMFFDACKNKWINTKGKGIRSSAYHQTCRYLHHDNPFLKIGPFIEEQLSKSPYMVIYHDILTDKEIEYLIKESHSQLSKIRKEVNEPNIHDYKSGKARKIIRKAH